MEEKYDPKYICGGCEYPINKPSRLEGHECSVCGYLNKMEYKDLERLAKKLAQKCRKLNNILESKVYRDERSLERFRKEIEKANKE